MSEVIRPPFYNDGGFYNTGAGGGGGIEKEFQTEFIDNLFPDLSFNKQNIGGVQYQYCTTNSLILFDSGMTGINKLNSVEFNLRLSSDIQRSEIGFNDDYKLIFGSSSSNSNYYPGFGRSNSGSYPLWPKSGIGTVERNGFSDFNQKIDGTDYNIFSYSNRQTNPGYTNPVKVKLVVDRDKLQIKVYIDSYYLTMYLYEESVEDKFYINYKRVDYKTSLTFRDFKFVGTN